MSAIRARRQRIEIRSELLRQDPHCMWCGKYFDRIPVWAGVKYMPTIEHIIPTTDGGTNDMNNLGLACHRCNQKSMAAYHTPEYGKYVTAGGLT